MSDHDQLERRLQAARRPFDEVRIAPDAWQENQRRLAVARVSRTSRWLTAAAVAVGVLIVGGLLLFVGSEPDSGPPASGGSGEDPWDVGNLLGPSVVAERLTVDGQELDHEIVLTDTDGNGPMLCDRLVAENFASGSCAAREPGADDPKVAFDWVTGSEGDGDLRGVLAGVDGRAAFVDVWMSDGTRVPAELHPTGWDDTQMFAYTVPSDGPRPQRLVASGRDGNVLQAVDLPTVFGPTWLAPRSACAGDALAETSPDPELLPTTVVALGNDDARISELPGSPVSTKICLRDLGASALGAWQPTDVAIIALVSPEVSAMRLVLPGAASDREIATARPMALNGALWRVATLPLENAQQKYQVEIVALDAGGNVLDETFARQPRTP